MDLVTENGKRASKLGREEIRPYQLASNQTHSFGFAVALFLFIR